MENQGSPSIVQQVIAPLYDAKGWMKFVGVMSIIYGALMILSIWGILICWLPIWIGVLLFSASNQVKLAFETANDAAAQMAQSKLATYFRILGVLLIIGIVLAVIGMIFAAAGVAAALHGMRGAQ